MHLIHTFYLLVQVNDAYSEVDDQRQHAASWKRKLQKANGELNDTKLLLEEQTSRNNLLEKKQRKFDSEIASLNDDVRTEAAAKEKIYREMDELKRLKYTMEDQLQVRFCFAKSQENYHSSEYILSVGGGSKNREEDRKREFPSSSLHLVFLIKTCLTWVFS